MRLADDTTTDADLALLRDDGWQPSPAGLAWWRDPQTGRDFTEWRALQLAAGDRQSALQTSSRSKEGRSDEQ